MGFRIRKSITLAPGVRLNLSTRGVGYSVGAKGMRVTRHANGRISRTLSLPGTGLSHQSTLRSARRGSSRTRPERGASAPLWGPPDPRPPKPGILAPGWEKDLFAVLDTSDPADFVAVARKHGRTEPQLAVLAATLEGLLLFERGGSAPEVEQRAQSLLGWAAVQQMSDSVLRFATTYLSERSWLVEIAPGISARLHLHDDVVLLAAAELHQAAGDLDAAIWTVEQCRPSAHAALSLVELYSCAQRHQDVIDLTNGVTNQDDATALLLALRGRAFAQLGFHEAAREGFTAALRVRSRSAPVRHRALVERAHVDLAQNRKAAARKSLEKILAEDPSYPGVREALDALV